MAVIEKKATNISLSIDVLTAAKTFGINISQQCDQHLRTLVNQEKQRRWLAEHADFIASYNQGMDTDGLPLEQFRNF